MTDEILNKVFDQASRHHHSVCLSNNIHDCYMFKAIQIVKHNNVIKIYNTTQAQSYYDEIEDYSCFILGWEAGVYDLTLSKYRVILLAMEEKERSLRNSDQPLKDREANRIKKKNILNKYYKISEKLNKIKNQ